MLESVARVAQYVGAAAGQAVWPEEQVSTHPRALHICPAAHCVPQAPQFAGSDWKLVQRAATPAPQASGSAAGQAQLPFEHCWPAGHAWPQAPQFRVSDVSVVQKAVAPDPQAFGSDGGQPQLPMEHT